MKDKIHLIAVGDVFIDREQQKNPFARVGEIFRSADIVFGNLEGAYTTHSGRAPSAGVPVVAHPQKAASLLQAGFTHMSLANNHALDAGHQGLHDTISLLQSQGITPFGAGMSFTEAHAPSVVTVGGVGIGFLAYTTVFPRGYEARGEVPGVAVVRGRDHYIPWEQNEWNPGLLPRINTVPDAGDLSLFEEDIKTLRKKTDFVVVSFHWGDFTRPYVVNEFERQLARFAIDSGAHAIVGHHHHLLRGFEFYKSCPILYGIGHFAFDLPNFSHRLVDAGYLVGQTAEEERAQAKRFGEYRLGPRDGYPLLPFHPDARLTCMVRILFDQEENGVSVYFIPCILGLDNIPKIANNEERGKILCYIDYCNRTERLEGRISPQREGADGNSVIQYLPS